MYICVVKKFFIIIIAFFLVYMPVMAQDEIKEIANINHEFTLNDIPEKIEFTSNQEMSFYDIIIPKNAIVITEVLGVQRERRWHKSGYILLKVESYKTETGEIVDLSNEKIYLIARKYKKIDYIDFTLTGMDVILPSAIAFVMPGIDMIYYFIKGAIEHENNQNWFKSGISNAYEYSIFWFWLKGKPIELDKNETISIKGINEIKAKKLKKRIEKKRKKK